MIAMIMNDGFGAVYIMEIMEAWVPCGINAVIPLVLNILKDEFSVLGVPFAAIFAKLFNKVAAFGGDDEVWLTGTN